MAALCVISYTAVIILSFVRDNFLTPFTIFAAVCIATSGVMFIISYIKTEKPHLLYYIIGVFIEVPGDIVQAKRDLYFTLIFKLDFNSIYHFILFISIILFIIGYKKERRHCPRS